MYVCVCSNVSCPFIAHLMGMPQHLTGSSSAQKHANKNKINFFKYANLFALLIAFFAFSSHIFRKAAKHIHPHSIFHKRAFHSLCCFLSFAANFITVNDYALSW